jgi:hypothetical protein
MPRITASQTLGKMKLGNADKIALTQIINGLVDDIETLRANQRAQATKLDNDAGVTDTNYTATTSTATGGLAVGK